MAQKAKPSKKVIIKRIDAVFDVFLLLSNVEAEEAVIGSCLIDEEAYREVSGILKPEDFSIETCKLIYIAISNLKVGIDQITVAQELSKMGKLEEIGGAAYLSQLIAQVITSINITYYAQIVKNLSQKRIYLRIMEDVMAEIVEDNTISDVLDHYNQMVKHLDWSPEDSRTVEFKDGRILTSSPPMYIYTISCAGKEARIRFDSEDLSSISQFKRKLRENLHVNPKLPKNFDDLIHNLVTSAVKEEAPMETKADSEIIYWLREWFKTASEAQIGADMDRGWKRKGDFYCIQPEPVCRWLKNVAKITVNTGGLWAIIEGFGAKRPISVRISKDPKDSLKLWGIPCSFFDHKGESLDTEDVSWLDDNEEA